MPNIDFQVPGDFEDPLKDYAPREPADPLERALAEEPISALQCRPFTTVLPDVSVELALQKMVSAGITCLLVAKEGQLQGVFSERDVLNRVAEGYEEIKHQAVSEVMTPNPIFLYETDALASALCVMTVHGFRHVPVLDSHENIVGIVSPQRVTSFLQEKVESGPLGAQRSQQDHQDDADQQVHHDHHRGE